MDQLGLSTADSDEPILVITRTHRYLPELAGAMLRLRLVGATPTRYTIARASLSQGRTPVGSVIESS